MNNIKLTSQMTQELNDSEIRNISGGGLLGLGLAIAGACIYVYNNWDDFKAGIKEGFKPY